jgi:hypothetical protein
MPEATVAGADDDPEHTQPVALPAEVSPSAKPVALPVAAPPKLPPRSQPAGEAPKSGDDMIRLVKLGTLTFVIVLVVFTLVLFIFGR